MRKAFWCFCLHYLKGPLGDQNLLHCHIASPVSCFKKVFMIFGVIKWDSFNPNVYLKLHTHLHKYVLKISFFAVVDNSSWVWWLQAGTICGCSCFYPQSLPLMPQERISSSLRLVRPCCRLCPTSRFVPAVLRTSLTFLHPVLRRPCDLSLLSLGASHLAATSISSLVYLVNTLSIGVLAHLSCAFASFSVSYFNPKNRDSAGHMLMI